MLLNPKSIINQRYRVIKRLNSSDFGETYEVEDLKTNFFLWVLKGKNKILKCLPDANEESVKFFKREVDALIQLQHPGIPKVDPETCYFEYLPENSFKPIHCLVMEKIEGWNLQEWLKQKNGNNPIDEQQAIAWLFQFLEILEYLETKKYIHVDIKPSNIMLTPNGKLVLIDFGGARDISPTYILKLGENREVVAAINSLGYTPQEQQEGRAYPQSQFFSLGRTFVYLLTAKEPHKLIRRGEVVWRDSASSISDSLANLINKMMAYRGEDRHASIEEIRQELEEIESQRWHLLSWLKQPSCKIALGGSAIAALTMGVRLTGILQSWELAVFDEMMRSRPPEAIDPRILVVEISEKETNPDKYGYPLKDGTLAELIEKIEQYQPQAIGLDIHRRQAQPPGREQLIKRFQQNQNLFTVCAFGNSVENYAPPGEFSQQQLKNQVGFSDMELDSWIDNSVRRQLLSYDSKFSKSPACITPYSFSFLLADEFLYAKGQQLEVNKKNEWYSGKAIFKRLAARTGGYQRASGSSNEILINYRSKPKSSFCKPAELPNNCEPIQRVYASLVLANQIDPKLIKNRIIFIGYTTPFISDEFNTPLGKMPGVLIHAHMTSQMLSAAIDGRPLLWVLPQWGDAIFVWGCAVVGCAIAWGCLQLRWKLVWVAGFTLVVSGITTLVLYVAGVGILAYGGWMPFVPSVLSLFATVAWVFYSISRA
jgi:CHASE2 domain-containing sensor protein